MVFFVQSVKAQLGTIYIRADGSIDPPTALISTTDNITYTFMGARNQHERSAFIRGEWKEPKILTKTA
jgi:hypothetical protein